MDVEGLPNLIFYFFKNPEFFLSVYRRSMVLTSLGCWIMW